MTISKIRDISRVISPRAVVYPGDDPLVVAELCRISSDCPCNISQLGWTTHFLTHVDPPLHFVEGGASLEEVPLTRFVGETIVIAVDGDSVKVKDIAAVGNIAGRNLLFKTRHSAPGTTEAPFDSAHVYVTEEAAHYVARAGANMLGHDYISVDRFGDTSYPAHRTLLGNGVLILEGVDLTDVSPGRYQLIALPLKISRGDGSPVRAVLADI